MSEVIIPGPAGRIEARCRLQENPAAPSALFLHHDSRLGGSMNAEIVYRLYHLFAENGFTVLRYNFRGAGRSAGEPGAGGNEITDAACVLDWLQSRTPESENHWVVGFSFGAWIAMQLLMRRPEVREFVAIAPLVDKYDFSFLQPCPGQGLIVQGDKDRVTPSSSVMRWADEVIEQKQGEITFKVIGGANHFFSEHMDRLSTTVENHIKARTRNNEAKPKRKSRKKNTAETVS